MAEMLHIHDGNYQDFIGDGQVLAVDHPHNGGEERKLGFVPRDWVRYPYGSVPHLKAPNIPLIPRSEWADRIQAAKGSELSTLAKSLPVLPLDQDGLNYCHAFSPVAGAMILRAAQNLPYVELSAGSVGGPVTNFKNDGAWIGDDLKQITQYGIASTAFVPMMQVKKNGWKPGAEENAMKNRVTEWWELEARNFDQVATLLLSRIPVCVGLNWWGHAVTYLDLVMIDSQNFGVLSLNSWGKAWGTGGYGILSGSKMVPDEAYAPRQILATAA